ncbi:YqjF family protein [Ornithinibacillus salinisoli]|uniref:YqjF family protein n=1 Tax=Ornithinibacillus salinisoli TaxID=1848459 RepID=A0ABW4W314_9BACI
MFEEILHCTTHREYPVPSGPWLMMQKWEHLLFIHWPIKPDVIQSLLPPGLEVDTFERQAWVSFVAFRVGEIRIRKIRLPFYLNHCLQLNVRTYVKRKGVRGVYFLSIDVDKLFAVIGARMLGLPYYFASMFLEKQNRHVSFQSVRRESSLLKLSYHVGNDKLSQVEKGSLSYWLLERYFLWTFKKGTLYRGGIHHIPWKVQDAYLDTLDVTNFYSKYMTYDKPYVQYANAKLALIYGIRKDEI